MALARPLRDLFTELTGDADAARAADPAELLSQQGHPDLPEELIAEAIVNYAETATPEVAEHLAPFVMAHSAAASAEPAEAGVDPGSWLDVLAGAPTGGADDPPGDLGEGDPAGLDELAGQTDRTESDVVGSLSATELDFGVSGEEPTWIYDGSAESTSRLLESEPTEGDRADGEQTEAALDDLAPQHAWHEMHEVAETTDQSEPDLDEPLDL